MFRTFAFITAAAGMLIVGSAHPPAWAQGDFAPCSASDYPGLSFGQGVPNYAVGFTQGQCYCGAWTNVTPQQAQQQGWYSSCNNGQGTCNFRAGDRASNVVCRKQ